MSSTLIDLLPLVLGAMLAPLWIIIVLLMLASPRGLAKAAAFVAGVTLVRLAQGVIFGVLFASSPAAEGAGSERSTVVSTLLLVVGILLLASAVAKWRKEVDADDPSPKWMESLDRIRPVKAFVLGVLLVAIGPKVWVFTLSALAIIADADLGRTSSIVAYIAYIVLAQLLLILAVVAYAVAPHAVGDKLQQLMSWLNRYNRPIAIVAALIFGLYFTWDGARSLMN